MALEKDKSDRSYQFGRLLAVMEKAEKDTYGSEEKRETNAIRKQTLFVKKPMDAFRLVMEQLKNAYYPKLSTGLRVYYERLIGEIMEKISQFGDGELNKPLSETYLLGYYLQKNELYSKNEKKETLMEDENNG